MENINIASVLLAAAAILSPIVTLILGVVQVRNKLERERAGVGLDIAGTAKQLGEVWESVTDELREEIERIKKSFREREKELLDDLAAMEIRLNQYQKHNETVMSDDMRRIKNLEERLVLVEGEKETYRTENVDLKLLVNRLTEKLSVAQEQLQAAKERIDVLEKQMKRVGQDEADRTVEVPERRKR